MTGAAEIGGQRDVKSSVNGLFHGAEGAAVAVKDNLVQMLDHFQSRLLGIPGVNDQRQVQGFCQIYDLAEDLCLALS